MKKSMEKEEIKKINRNVEEMNIERENSKKNYLSIVVFIVAIISIIFNICLINDITEKNKIIKTNAYKYIDNLLEYKPTLIDEISQMVIKESVEAVEIETNGRYTGDRVDGKKSGIGKYEWNNGNVYEGEFSNDLMHGKGKLTTVGKGTYEGNFVAGKKSGEGKYTFANGDVYTGEWANDTMEGEGTYTFANGDSYNGAFYNNMFNGRGTYKKDGKSYTGTWKNNVYNQ